MNEDILHSRVCIVILVESPFSQRDFDRFGIEILKRNFKVFICDFTEWLHPEFYRIHEKTETSNEEIFHIHSKNEFQNFLYRINYEVKIAIDQLSSHRNAFWVRKKIKEYSFRLTQIQNGLIPTSPSETDLVSHIKSKIFSFNEFKKILLRNLFKLIPKENIKHDIVVISGKSGLQSPGVQEIEHKIYSHSFDYDLVINSKRELSEPIIKDYILFLDEDMVHHSDYLHDGFKPPIEEEEYYYHLNRFFDTLEKELKLKVIWALHPRAEYDKRKHLLKNRLSFVGETLRLVQNAKLVLLHSSTSISFPVISRKPLLFMTMKKLDSSWIGPRIRYRAGLFDKEACFIDQQIPLNLVISDVLEINEEHYKHYEEQFIKFPGTSMKPSWEIFSDYIRETL